MHPGDSEYGGWNRCEKQQQDGANRSDHVIKNPTISILSQLRKYEIAHSVIIRLLFTLSTGSAAADDQR
jgi:hypothetical protein